MQKILVIGSINVDFVVSSKVRPKIGETVIGEKLTVTYGGKGANQAIAAARLKASVSMIGKVGVDFIANDVLENLNKNNVDISNVESIQQSETGSAHITLSDGDNSIIVIPGANNCFEKNFIEKFSQVILQHDFVIVQNEIPAFIVEQVLDFCYINNIDTIYNPAPFREIALDTLLKAKYITPNEHEAISLLKTKNLKEIVKQYPNQVIITLGSKGAMYFDGEKIVKVKAIKTTVVDTTGAGDTFNGALAVALSKDEPLFKAINFANVAASLSIEKLGAQAGMPSLSMVEEKFKKL